MRSLVLGGSTFVGRRLVHHLAEYGHEVAVLNRGRTPSELPSGVRRYVADRTDVGSMRLALAGTEWDAVFDVSGFVMVAGGSPIADLLALFDGRTAAYVFVSSIMAYQPSSLMPWTEDQPTSAEPVTTYGGFKAYAESEVRKRHEQTGFPGSIARPAAIYGPDNNILDMETAMFLRLRRGLPVLLPHGGLVTGNYGHVDDLCALLVAMALAPQAVAGEVVNATGQAITTAGYVRALAEIVGVEPEIHLLPDDLLGKVPGPLFGHLFGVRHHAVISTEKARGVGLPDERGFVEGHRQTYEWFCSSPFADAPDAMSDPVLGRRVRLRGRGQGPRAAMTVFVEDAVLVDAQRRAERLPLSPAEQRRWQEVAAYRAARRPDPNPERAAVLRDLLGLSGADDRQVLDTAGRLLSDAVTGDAELAGPVYARCRQWFDEDVTAAAPLLDLFTGHHRDPEGGPPAADPELADRLARWLDKRGVRLRDVTVISGGFSRLMLDVHWVSGRGTRGGHGVVRIEQDGMFGTEGRREASVMRILRERGYPVPAIVWEEPDPDALGHPFFVMEFVDGRARTDDEGLDDMLRAPAQAARPRPASGGRGRRAGRPPGRPRAGAGHRRPAAALARRVPVGRGLSDPAARTGLRVAARQPAGHRSVGHRARRPRAGKRAAGRLRGGRGHRLGARPRRRRGRGLGLPRPDPRPSARLPGLVEDKAGHDGGRAVRRADLARLGGVQLGQGRLRQPHRAGCLRPYRASHSRPARHRGSRAPALPAPCRGTDRLNGLR